MGDLATAIEGAARAYLAIEQGGFERSGHRSKAFMRIAGLLESRMNRLLRGYGFHDMPDDARQACMIGILRALESYDPSKARFTTHVTWSMRGELQSLRHRERLDQRQGARSAGVRMVAPDISEVFEVVDDRALELAERPVRNRMAKDFLAGLLRRSGQPDRERELVVAHIFDRPVPTGFSGKSNEQRRQIIRRNLRHCARVAQAV